MFYLQRTELGHFNLYPGLLQGIKPRALAGLSCQFIIGQQPALNCRVPGFDLNKNTVKPLITDPPKSEQPLYSGRLTCPRLLLP